MTEHRGPVNSSITIRRKKGKSFRNKKEEMFPSLASIFAPTLTKYLTQSKDPYAAATQIKGTFFRDNKLSFICGMSSLGLTCEGTRV